jgi:gamma-D-glutamyl-L-lysine dipeptidyl-peptidase
MEFGVCTLSAVAVRERPDHKFEMVSQLLFGELFEILEQRNGWFHIRIIHDSYQGWVSVDQVEPLEFAEYQALRNHPPAVTGDLLAFIQDKTHQTSFPISAGCSVYFPQNGNISLGGKVFHYPGQLLELSEPQPELITDHALLFLNTPYLWGGRSVFGMDCSGFVQLIYKMAGIKIPRDAAIQSTQGESVHLIHETKPGDLLFFDNQEGDINHVGILLQDGYIIHSHGMVRIDLIDHNGIFNKGKNRYTHKLRLIRRISSV